MPLLVAIDEYENALRAIAVHAEIGLSAGPGQAEAALRAIRMVCEKTSETIGEVLSHPAAVSQASVAGSAGAVP